MRNPAPASPRRRRVGAGFLLVATLLLAAGLASCGDGGSGPGAEPTTSDRADWAFTIPAGAGAWIDAGEPLEILPGEMDVRVGEIIRIVNEDDRGHIVGPFFVGAGETLVQRFSSPGEFVGECSVHPSGQLVLRVRA